VFSGILNQPTKISNSFSEGVIVTVNTATYTAQVKTLTGQLISNATWLMPVGSNDREADIHTPSVGTQVLLFIGTGRPIILGAVPIANVYLRTGVHSITDTGVNTLEYHGGTGLPRGLTHAPSMPADYQRGDRVIASKGGSSLSVLWGTVIMRASAMAQIVVSKLDDLIRLVGRNFELITDACTDVSVNWRGRGYRFFGTALTVPAQINSNYGMYEVWGDTVAGETLKDESYGQPATAALSANTYIYKSVVCSYGSTGQQNLRVETIDGTTGTSTVVVSGSTTVTMTQTASSFEVILSNPDTYVLINPTNLICAFESSMLILNSAQAQLVSNENSVTVNSDGVTLSSLNNPNTYVSMNPTNLVCAFESSVLTLNSSQAQLASNGHAVTVNSGGVVTS
jgi:hypothetical protein